jgi:hypothetical protein
VNTAWGCGYIEQVRATDYVVRLKVWQLAQGQSPTLHLQGEALTPIPQGCYPGAQVNTFCGPATVLKVRPDTVIKCKPTVWQLASYSPDIFLFLNAQSVKVVQGQ